MRTPRPETYLAFSVLTALSLALPACCGEGDDSAKDEGVQLTSESAFIERHSEALCANEPAAIMEWPGSLDYSEPVPLDGDDCEPRLVAFYEEHTILRFSSEIAEGCHSAYLNETAPAPSADLGWRWCAFAWLP